MSSASCLRTTVLDEVPICMSCLWLGHHNDNEVASTVKVRPLLRIFVRLTDSCLTSEFLVRSCSKLVGMGSDKLFGLNCEPILLVAILLEFWPPQRQLNQGPAVNLKHY